MAPLMNIINFVSDHVKPWDPEQCLLDGPGVFLTFIVPHVDELTKFWLSSSLTQRSHANLDNEQAEKFVEPTLADS